MLFSRKADGFLLSETPVSNRRFYLGPKAVSFWAFPEDAKGFPQILHSANTSRKRFGHKLISNREMYRKFWVSQAWQECMGPQHWGEGTRGWRLGSI